MFDVHPDIEGLTLFAAEAGRHVHEVHAHGAHSVIVVVEGAKLFHHAGRTVRVAAGEIAISNPGDLHGCEPADGQAWAHLTWYVDPALMREMGTDLWPEGEPRLRAPVIRDGALAERLNDAHRASRRGEVLDRQTSALEALRALIHLYGDGAEPRVADAGAAAERMPAYEAVIGERIDAGQAGQLVLADLARAGGVSRNQVIRDFREVHGITPGQFFRIRRLDFAKACIAEGENLASVSSLAGFSDQSHFTRAFRKAYGITPSVYARTGRRSGDTSPASPGARGVGARGAARFRPW